MSGTAASLALLALIIVGITAASYRRFRTERRLATNKDQDDRRLKPWEVDNWLIRRVARIEDKLNRLHGKVDKLMTKEDGRAIIQAVKALRDVLLKPELSIALGQPTDQQEK